MFKETPKAIQDYLYQSIKINADKYNFKREDEGSQIIRIYKLNDKIKFTLGCVITLDFEKNTLYGFTLNIYYLEVTSILNPILVKHKLRGGKKTDHFPLLGKVINEIEMPFSKLQDLDSFTEIYNSTFINEAIPYFSRWATLTAFYDFVKDLDDDELSDIFGIYHTLKKATIMRLCNDSGYQIYMDSYYEVQKKYYEEDSDDEDNICYYNAAKELKHILDNTKPIYNI